MTHARPIVRALVATLVALATAVGLFPAAATAATCAPSRCPMGGCDPAAGMTAAMPCCQTAPALPGSDAPAPSAADVTTAAVGHPAAAPAPTLAIQAVVHGVDPAAAGRSTRGLYTLHASLLI